MKLELSKPTSNGCDLYGFGLIVASSLGFQPSQKKQTPETKVAAACASSLTDPQKKSQPQQHSEINNEEVEYWLSQARHDGLILEYAPDHVKSNKRVVIAAVEQNGFALEFTTETLQDDFQIVMIALTKDGMVLKFASKHLCANKEVVLKAVRLDPFALAFACRTIRDDKEIVLIAVRLFGMVLEYASSRLRKDKDVVVAAVSQCGEALAFACPSLRCDKETLRAARSTLKHGCWGDSYCDYRSDVDDVEVVSPSLEADTAIR